MQYTGSDIPADGYVEEEGAGRRRGGGSSGGGSVGTGCNGVWFCCALFGPFMMLNGALSRWPVITAKRWAAQPWKADKCVVQDSGYEYVGTCWTPSWTRSCPLNCSGTSGWDLYQKVVLVPVPGENQVGARRLRGCHNSYVPWYSVLNGNGTTTCAYGYALDNLNDVQYDASDILPKAGAIVDCQTNTAPGAECVVAFKDVNNLVAERREASQFSFIAMWVFLPISLLAWLCLCAICCMICLAVQRSEPNVRKDAFLGGKAAHNLHVVDAMSSRLNLPPGHWSQWSAEQVSEASEALFTYYDTDGSGHLDVNEMVQIMGHLGIHDRHLVLRTMHQLDADQSGLIEREEFEDLCRQIFWNGQQKLVTREFARQQEIMGNSAVSATGLSKNRPLLCLELLILIGCLVAVIWIEQKYGHRSCDTRFDRYLQGAAVLICFEIVLLLLVFTLHWWGRKCSCTNIMMCAQGAMILLHVFVLAYAVAGTVMELSSQICEQNLRGWTLLVVMMFWASGLYVVLSGIAGFVAACFAVRKGTNLSTLALDDDPDSDSEYEEIDIE